MAIVKCWSCSNEAIVLANSCSPTSSSGLTETRPRCADCLVSMAGYVNVEYVLGFTPDDVQLLIKEAKQRKMSRSEQVYPQKISILG